MLPGRQSQLSGNNYKQQQEYHPHGPPGPMLPYDSHQRGPYTCPSPGHHYLPQPYGNYPQPRCGFGPSQGPPPHHYYTSTHMPGHHASGPPSPSMVPPHSEANYNYGPHLLKGVTIHNMAMDTVSCRVKAAMHHPNSSTTGHSKAQQLIIPPSTTHHIRLLEFWVLLRLIANNIHKLPMVRMPTVRPNLQ